MDSKQIKLELVWGAENIGQEINLTARQTYHALETGKLSEAAKKVGGKWVAERGKLRDFFTQQDGVEMAHPSIPAGLPKKAMDYIINVRDIAIAGANMKISVDQARIENVLGMREAIRMAADMELSADQADMIAEADAALTDLLATWGAR